MSGRSQSQNITVNVYKPVTKTTPSGNVPQAVTVTNGPNAGHPVEVGGDKGCWDTVANVFVNQDNTNLETR